MGRHNLIYSNIFFYWLIDYKSEVCPKSAYTYPETHFVQLQSFKYNNMQVYIKIIRKKTDGSKKTCNTWQQNPFPADNFIKYKTKQTPKIIIF